MGLPEVSHHDATTIADDPDCELFDWEAFQTNGLLWAVNRHVLHPRGLAMAVMFDEDTNELVGWQIHRADDGLWRYGEQADELGRARFQGFLNYLETRVF